MSPYWVGSWPNVSGRLSGTGKDWVAMAKQQNRVPGPPGGFRRGNRKYSDWGLHCSAHVGNDSDSRKGVIGMIGLGLDISGALLVDMWPCQSLLIMNTMFEHKCIHQFVLHQGTLGRRLMIYFVVVSSDVVLVVHPGLFREEGAELVTIITWWWVGFDVRGKGGSDSTGPNVLRIFFEASVKGFKSHIQDQHRGR